MERNNILEIIPVARKNKPDFFNDQLVLEAIENQKYLTKKIPEYEEKNKWFSYEVVNFQVYLGNVDRVYFHEHIHDLYGSNIYCYLEAYFRMKCNDGAHVFIGLVYKSKINSGDTFFNTKHKSGALFLTKDVNIFTKSMMKFYFQTKSIYLSLRQDNYMIYGDHDFTNFFRDSIINRGSIYFPSLEMECIYSLYKHFGKSIVSEDGESLLIKNDILPLHILKKLKNFIIYFSTRIMFEEQLADYFIG